MPVASDDIEFIGEAFCFMFIPMYFLIYPKGLANKNSFKLVFIVCVLFAIAGLLQIAAHPLRSPMDSAFWFYPLYGAGLYRLLTIPFYKRYHRYPIVPPTEFFYTGDLSNLGDRLFGLVFLILSLLLPMYHFFWVVPG